MAEESFSLGPAAERRFFWTTVGKEPTVTIGIATPDEVVTFLENADNTQKVYPLYLRAVAFLARLKRVTPGRTTFGQPAIGFLLTAQPQSVSDIVDTTIPYSWPETITAEWLQAQVNADVRPPNFLVRNNHPFLLFEEQGEDPGFAILLTVKQRQLAIGYYVISPTVLADMAPDRARGSAAVGADFIDSFKHELEFGRRNIPYSRLGRILDDVWPATVLLSTNQEVAFTRQDREGEIFRGQMSGTTIEMTGRLPSNDETTTRVLTVPSSRTVVQTTALLVTPEWLANLPTTNRQHPNLVLDKKGVPYLFFEEFDDGIVVLVRENDGQLEGFIEERHPTEPAVNSVISGIRAALYTADRQIGTALDTLHFEPFNTRNANSTGESEFIVQGQSVILNAYKPDGEQAATGTFPITYSTDWFNAVPDDHPSVIWIEEKTGGLLIKKTKRTKLVILQLDTPERGLTVLKLDEDTNEVGATTLLSRSGGGDGILAQLLGTLKSSTRTLDARVLSRGSHGATIINCPYTPITQNGAPITRPQEENLGEGYYLRYQFRGGLLTHQVLSKEGGDSAVNRMFLYGENPPWGSTSRAQASGDAGTPPGPPPPPTFNKLSAAYLQHLALTQPNHPDLRIIDGEPYLFFEEQGNNSKLAAFLRVKNGQLEIAPLTSSEKGRAQSEDRSGPVDKAMAANIKLVYDYKKILFSQERTVATHIARKLGALTWYTVDDSEKTKVLVASSGDYTSRFIIDNFDIVLSRTKGLVTSASDRLIMPSRAPINTQWLWDTIAYQRAGLITVHEASIKKRKRGKTEYRVVVFEAGEDLVFVGATDGDNELVLFYGNTLSDELKKKIRETALTRPEHHLHLTEAETTEWVNLSGAGITENGLPRDTMSTDSQLLAVRDQRLYVGSSGPYYTLGTRITPQWFSALPNDHDDRIFVGVPESGGPNYVYGLYAQGNGNFERALIRNDNGTLMVATAAHNPLLRSNTHLAQMLDHVALSGRGGVSVINDTLTNTQLAELEFISIEDGTLPDGTHYVADGLGLTILAGNGRAQGRIELASHYLADRTYPDLTTAQFKKLGPLDRGVVYIAYDKDTEVKSLLLTNQGDEESYILLQLDETQREIQLIYVTQNEPALANAFKKLPISRNGKIRVNLDRAEAGRFQTYERYSLTHNGRPQREIEGKRRQTRVSVGEEPGTEVTVVDGYRLRGQALEWSTYLGEMGALTYQRRIYSVKTTQPSRIVETQGEPTFTELSPAYLRHLITHQPNHPDLRVISGRRYLYLPRIGSSSRDVILVGLSPDRQGLEVIPIMSGSNLDLAQRTRELQQIERVIDKLGRNQNLNAQEIGIVNIYVTTLRQNGNRFDETNTARFRFAGGIYRYEIRGFSIQDSIEGIEAHEPPYTMPTQAPLNSRWLADAQLGEQGIVDIRFEIPGDFGNGQPFTRRCAIFEATDGRVGFLVPVNNPMGWTAPVGQRFVANELAFGLYPNNVSGNLEPMAHTLRDAARHGRREPIVITTKDGLPPETKIVTEDGLPVSSISDIYNSTAIIDGRRILYYQGAESLGETVEPVTFQLVETQRVQEAEAPTDSRTNIPFSRVATNFSPTSGLSDYRLFENVTYGVGFAFRVVEGGKIERFQTYVLGDNPINTLEDLFRQTMGLPLICEAELYLAPGNEIQNRGDGTHAFSRLSLDSDESITVDFREGAAIGERTEDQEVLAYGLGLALDLRPAGEEYGALGVTELKFKNTLDQTPPSIVYTFNLGEEAWEIHVQVDEDASLQAVRFASPSHPRGIRGEVSSPQRVERAYRGEGIEYHTVSTIINNQRITASIPSFVVDKTKATEDETRNFADTSAVVIRAITNMDAVTLAQAPQTLNNAILDFNDTAGAPLYGFTTNLETGTKVRELTQITTSPLPVFAALGLNKFGGFMNSVMQHRSAAHTGMTIPIQWGASGTVHPYTLHYELDGDDGVFLVPSPGAPGGVLQLTKSGTQIRAAIAGQAPERTALYRFLNYATQGPKLTLREGSLIIEGEGDYHPTSMERPELMARIYPIWANAANGGALDDTNVELLDDPNVIASKAKQSPGGTQGIVSLPLVTRNDVEAIIDNRWTHWKMAIQFDKNDPETVLQVAALVDETRRAYEAYRVYRQANPLSWIGNVTSTISPQVVVPELEGKNKTVALKIEKTVTPQGDTSYTLNGATVSGHEVAIGPIRPTGPITHGEAVELVCQTQTQWIRVAVTFTGDDTTLALTKERTQVENLLIRPSQALPQQTQAPNGRVELVIAKTVDDEGNVTARITEARVRGISVPIPEPVAINVGVTLVLRTDGFVETVPVTITSETTLTIGEAYNFQPLITQITHRLTRNDLPEISQARNRTLELEILETRNETQGTSIFTLIRATMRGLPVLADSIGQEIAVGPDSPFIEVQGDTHDRWESVFVRVANTTDLEMDPARHLYYPTAGRTHRVSSNLQDPIIPSPSTGEGRGEGETVLSLAITLVENPRSNPGSIVRTIPEGGARLNINLPANIQQALGINTQAPIPLTTPLPDHIEYDTPFELTFNLGAMGTITYTVVVNNQNQLRATRQPFNLADIALTPNGSNGHWETLSAVVRGNRVFDSMPLTQHTFGNGSLVRPQTRYTVDALHRDTLMGFMSLLGHSARYNPTNDTHLVIGISPTVDPQGGHLLHRVETLYGVRAYGPRKPLPMGPLDLEETETRALNSALDARRPEETKPTYVNPTSAEATLLQTLNVQPGEVFLPTYQTLRELKDKFKQKKLDEVQNLEFFSTGADHLILSIPVIARGNMMNPFTLDNTRAVEIVDPTGKRSPITSSLWASAPHTLNFFETRPSDTPGVRGQKAYDLRRVSHVDVFEEEDSEKRRAVPLFMALVNVLDTQGTDENRKTLMQNAEQQLARHLHNYFNVNSVNRPKQPRRHHMPLRRINGGQGTVELAMSGALQKGRSHHLYSLSGFTYSRTTPFAHPAQHLTLTILDIDSSGKISSKEELTVEHTPSSQEDIYLLYATTPRTHDAPNTFVWNKKRNTIIEGIPDVLEQLEAGEQTDLHNTLASKNLLPTTLVEREFRGDTTSKEVAAYIAIETSGRPIPSLPSQYRSFVYPQGDSVATLTLSNASLIQGLFERINRDGHEVLIPEEESLMAQTLVGRGNETMTFVSQNLVLRLSMFQERTPPHRYLVQEEADSYLGLNSEESTLLIRNPFTREAYIAAGYTEPYAEYYEISHARIRNFRQSGHVSEDVIVDIAVTGSDEINLRLFQFGNTQTHNRRTVMGFQVRPNTRGTRAITQMAQPWLRHWTRRLRLHEQPHMITFEQTIDYNAEPDNWETTKVDETTTKGILLLDQRREEYAFALRMEIVREDVRGNTTYRVHGIEVNPENTQAKLKYKTMDGVEHEFNVYGATDSERSFLYLESSEGQWFTLTVNQDGDLQLWETPRRLTDHLRPTLPQEGFNMTGIFGDYQDADNAYSYAMRRSSTRPGAYEITTVLGRHTGASPIDLLRGDLPRVRFDIWKNASGAWEAAPATITEDDVEDTLWNFRSRRPDGSVNIEEDSPFQIEVRQDTWIDSSGTTYFGKIRVTVLKEAYSPYVNEEEAGTAIWKPYATLTFAAEENVIGSDTQFKLLDAHYHNVNFTDTYRNGGNQIRRKLMPQNPRYLSERAGVGRADIDWDNVFYRFDAESAILRGLQRASEDDPHNGSHDGSSSLILGALYSLSVNAERSRDSGTNREEWEMFRDVRGVWQYNDCVIASLTEYALNLPIPDSGNQQSPGGEGENAETPEPTGHRAQAQVGESAITTDVLAGGALWTIGDYSWIADRVPQIVGSTKSRRDEALPRPKGTIENHTPDVSDLDNVFSDWDNLVEDMGCTGAVQRLVQEISQLKDAQLLLHVLNLISLDAANITTNQILEDGFVKPRMAEYQQRTPATPQTWSTWQTTMAPMLVLTTPAAFRPAPAMAPVFH